MSGVKHFFMKQIVALLEILTLIFHLFNQGPNGREKLDILREKNFDDFFLKQKANMAENFQNIKSFF